MAYRFPGANDIEAFWCLLERGGNAVSEGVSGSGEGRWGQIFGDNPVQSAGCRSCVFVDGIELFDDAFLRISPVEAELLDPQQRMMLEVSWQALEDACIDPESLKESRTGVYSGISNDEYRMLVVDSAKPSEAAACLYALSGTNLNGTAGRVSFVLGLTGLAKAVDAACASAMVAINDAVADLQQGKANLAIAGGVQAILNGRIYELRADAMMLSPEGQCKTFDASADGYVRAEGCGVVILKRLSDAEADGDRIWAVVRGSVVKRSATPVSRIAAIPARNRVSVLVSSPPGRRTSSPVPKVAVRAAGTRAEVPGLARRARPGDFGERRPGAGLPACRCRVDRRHRAHSFRVPRRAGVPRRGVAARGAGGGAGGGPGAGAARDPGAAPASEGHLRIRRRGRRAGRNDADRTKRSPFSAQCWTDVTPR